MKLTTNFESRLWFILNSTPIDTQTGISLDVADISMSVANVGVSISSLLHLHPSQVVGIPFPNLNVSTSLGTCHPTRPIRHHCHWNISCPRNLLIIPSSFGDAWYQRNRSVGCSIL
jgi:hypothetical protein